MIEPEYFLNISNEIIKLKMFPYFDIAHAALCCLAAREDLGQGQSGLLFTRKYPLSIYISTMFSIYSGTMMANLFLGESMLAPLKNNNQLLLYSVIYYIIFYTPFDLGHKIFKFLPIKLLLCCMKEIYRTKKVYDGVTHALKVFPNGYAIALVVGTVKGNGAGFMKIIERLLRGVWTPNIMEILHPSFYTKGCALASIIFILDKKTDLISAPHSLLYFGIVVFFVYFKISSILLGIHDPFQPFENIFCALFMGNFADAITRAFIGGPTAPSTKQESMPMPETKESKPEGKKEDGKEGGGEEEDSKKKD